MNVKKIILEELTQALNEYLVNDEPKINVHKFFDNLKVARYVKSGEELFVQFHTKELKKISRKYDWLDIAPSGFYGVPLTPESIHNVIDQHGRRAAKPKITIFRVQGNVLRVSKYGLKELERDITKLITSDPATKVEIMNWKNELKKGGDLSNINGPGKYFSFLRELNQFLVNDLKDLDKLYTVLGYDAIFDDVGYCLVQEFPQQIAVLEKEAVKVKVSLDNPIFQAKKSGTEEIK